MLTLPLPRPVPAGAGLAFGPRTYRALPSLYTIPMVAMTVLVMAYSGLMGPLGIVVLYGLWLPLMVLKGIAVASPPKGSGFALAYFVLSCASIVWSDYLGTTLRAAFELGTMMLCTFIMVRVVPNAAYVKGLILGTGSVLFASLVSGNYGIDAFGGPPTLIGLFGSKNQLGFFAELGIYVSLVFCIAKGSRSGKLFYGVPTLSIGLICLVRSHSASSIASLAIALVVVAAVCAISGLSPRLRGGLTITAAVALPLILVLGASLGLETLVLQSFGKDATLTGRTYLWGEGFKIGMRHPGFGVGYAAFWVQGRPEAEQFWYQFFIANRGGFHFHDTYVEVFVELGTAGFASIVAWMGATLFRVLRMTAKHGVALDLILPVGIMIILVIRSFVEVDILGPFGMGLFLLLPILPRLRVMGKIQDTAGNR